MEYKMFQTKPLGKCIGTVIIFLNILETKPRKLKIKKVHREKKDNLSLEFLLEIKSLRLLPNYKVHKVTSLEL